MIIDAYTHIIPASVGRAFERLDTKFALAKRLSSIPELYDLEMRFRAMDTLGDYRQVVSLPNPPIEAVTTPEQAASLARLANDALAELVSSHSDRFPAFVACLPMHELDSTLLELKHAVENLGACGIQIFTNVNGRPLDDPRYRPIFEAMATYDLPIWLHPARTPSTADYASEARSRFEMWWCFGWPYETTVAMSRLALSGVFDRHPTLKIITHHLGGMVPYFDKRIENGLAVLGSRSGDDEDARAVTLLRRPLIEYFHLFYADTALLGASRGLRCGLDFFGSSNVVFASDAPFGPIAETYKAVSDLSMDWYQRISIESRNIERLTRIAVK
jgi:predicted TIM-barrel fold metal-dependent hydrolase